MVKSQNTDHKLSFLIFGFLICNLLFGISLLSAQQSDDLELNLDITANTTPLPPIFKPNIDLSGRGFHQDASFPQTVAAQEALNIWQKDIGFAGLYRIQYNLWEIAQLSKDKDMQNKLIANYDNIIKNINDAGGIVLLDIFGTPAGLGRVLDKKSPPKDIKAFKQIVKSLIRDLSCVKRYNIWYEVWSAPDLDGFFLGRKQEYFSLYQAVAESINELKLETKIHIPLGGPGASWWFQNFDGNTIATPERSLVYELIKFCYHYRLPLDFITWHGYSTDPSVEKEGTIYKKNSVTLVRDWLSYFSFDRHTPLIVDEWNFDRDANVLSARGEQSFIAASFMPSRLKNMFDAGIDYQLLFSLEDFQDNEEGVVRNTGVFAYDAEGAPYKGSPKAIYNALRMLSALEENMFSLKMEDDFAGAIATKDKDRVAILIYNYIDPDIVINLLTRNIANLNVAERKILLNIIDSSKLENILQRKLDIASVRATGRIRNLLKKAIELNDKAKKFESSTRKLNLSIKGLKEDYHYQRFVVDSTCALNCEFVPAEEKDFSATDLYQETLSLKPYSLNLIILKVKPKEAPKVSQPLEQPVPIAAPPEEANSTTKKQ